MKKLKGLRIVKSNKNRKINFKKYFYVFLNSNNKYEVTTDKFFINKRVDIVPIKLSHIKIWDIFKVDQYRDTPLYEYYERGSFEDYMGYFVRVNNFVKDYNEEFEYKIKLNEVKKENKEELC